MIDDSPLPQNPDVPFIPTSPLPWVPAWDKAQAAIALKVPCSGIPELDAMIRESRRLDMATAAMQGIMADRDACGTDWQFARIAMCAADALLAASGKESGK